ncbi:Epiplakin [Manis pentadactyla]|nr:Epiplakin [Manis pentadactyla]
MEKDTKMPVQWNDCTEETKGQACAVCALDFLPSAYVDLALEKAFQPLGISLNDERFQAQFTYFSIGVDLGLSHHTFLLCG